MYKIGFKNFRRFKNFEEIEYSGITFLVGSNNAGKSTMVKALLLINDFLKSGDISTFSFVNKNLEDANIVTYGRAKNRNSNNEHNYISFIFYIDDYYVEIEISGDDDKTFAYVQSLHVFDASNNLNIRFEPVYNTIQIFKANIFDYEQETHVNENIVRLDVEIKYLKDKIDASELKKSSKEYILLLEELNNIKEKRALFNKEEKTNTDEFNYSVITEYKKGVDMKDIVGDAIYDSLNKYDLEFKEIQRGASASKEFEGYRGIKEESILIIESFDLFYTIITNGICINYLGANPSKQSALFPIRDKNNALAQSIHDFYQSKILPGDTSYRFIEKWMKAFEVGESFEIQIHAGEAYEVKILSNGTKIHLADKGMGSIQAMLLILRLAVIIHKFSDKLNTVIIEEPEQNLHPALQSKLAEMFLECHEKYQLDFIIETHSEYIIRKSQVLAAEKEFATYPNINPFNTYYFPKEIDQQPYRLEYQEDGSFNRNFGEGFFDEASSRTLELLKLKRQKKA